ncbi:MAG: thiamine pyrophosphate-binding protein [Bacteroides caccae]|jgi:2-succinyl-5-enolpyruvyl-6-hydroxy-3-cyclohexene-1-carboxylate synthase
MRTDIIQIQQIVSLLKQYNIKHLVLSPGTRHVPLVHIVEMDSFFHCYSVVDERSAAYVALGLAEALGQPVGFACTSATATCNYMPAMKEAFERNIQLVALTADKQRYIRFHGASQVINQVDMYKPFARYSVDLPIIKNKMDEWYSNRSINEALLELDHHGKGPVQINFLEPEDINELATFKKGEMPHCRKIDRVDSLDNIENYKEQLKKKQRILVICGQNSEISDTLTLSLKKFFEKYNCVITYDNFSNVTDKEFILSPLLGVTLNREEAKNLAPDLIITYGAKPYSTLIRHFKGKGIEHWDVNPEGKVFDTSMSLSKIFECQPTLFFDEISKVTLSNNKCYLDKWLKTLSSRDASVNEFTNYYAVKRVLNSLPEGCNIHASVLNSMKFTNMCNLPTNTFATGNICTDGIDGALSTFLGQASLFKSLSLLIIGDLSYLYDLNASITDFNNNVRILLVNNQAGGEFHFNIGKQKISTLDRHIAASHTTRIENVIGLTNLHYLHAGDKSELERNIPEFLSESKYPILMEVFTNAEFDGISLRKIFRDNTPVSVSNKVAGCISKLFGASVKNKIKEIIYG